MCKTYTAFTTVDSEVVAYTLSEHLNAINPQPSGVGTFEIEDGSGYWEIGAYFTESPDTTALSILSTLYNARPFVVSELEDKDWVTEVQRELTPVPAGKFFVYGAHDVEKLPMTSTGIRIEAAVAFGTGHHGTTKGCLLAMQNLHLRGFNPNKVADIGCGTGILAIGAAKLWHCFVHASDMDPIAVRTSQENVRINGMNNHVRTFVATGTKHQIFHQSCQYNLVVANILAKPLKNLAPEVAHIISKKGYVILSGILVEQGKDVLQMYRGWKMSLVKKIELNGWVTLILQAM